MAKRTVQSRRRVKIPIGDLRNTVFVVRQASVPRADGDTIKVTETIFKKHAKIDTRSQGTGSQGGGHERVINGKNTGPSSTHVFTFRYDDRITKELMLQFDGSFFEILGVENIDGRREYTKVIARISGDETLESAQA